jgi:chromosome segregation ATPase
MEMLESEYSQKIKILFFIFLLVFGIFWYKKNQEINQLKEEVANQEDLISEYKDAVNDANDNIEEANDQIENARGYVEESYEDMSSTLDSLYTVDTVRVP